MKALQAMIGSWQIATFGVVGRRPAMIEHLRRELAEYERSGHASELADIVILTIGLATTDGVDLDKEVLEKMKINFRRKWKAPDAQGVIEHEEEKP